MATLEYDANLSISYESLTNFEIIPPYRNLYALLVGINEYQNHDHYKPLSAAIRDVTDIERFLLSKLSVPQDRVRKLLDGDATRTQIIKEIEALQFNSDICYGDPILIYYAGHGTRSQAPAGYNTYASDGKVECLCPADISPPNASSPVTAIPDVVLGLLLSELAEKKGNNILCPLQRHLQIYGSNIYYVDCHSRLLSFSKCRSRHARHLV